jgi:hypothetical protein
MESVKQEGRATGTRGSILYMRTEMEHPIYSILSTTDASVRCSSVTYANK